jgi:hypothetical protein
MESDQSGGRIKSSGNPLGHAEDEFGQALDCKPVEEKTTIKTSTPQDFLSAQSGKTREGHYNRAVLSTSQTRCSIGVHQRPHEAGMNASFRHYRRRDRTTIKWCKAPFNSFGEE